MYFKIIIFSIFNPWLSTFNLDFRPSTSTSDPQPWLFTLDLWPSTITQTLTHELISRQYVSQGLTSATPLKHLVSGVETLGTRLIWMWLAVVLRIYFRLINRNVKEIMHSYFYLIKKNCFHMQNGRFLRAGVIWNRVLSNIITMWSVQAAKLKKFFPRRFGWNKKLRLDLIVFYILSFCDINFFSK